MRSVWVLQLGGDDTRPSISVHATERHALEVAADYLSDEEDRDDVPTELAALRAYVEGKCGNDYYCEIDACVVSGDEQQEDTHA